MPSIASPRSPLWLALVAAGALTAGIAAAATEESQGPLNDVQKLIDSGNLRGAEIELRNAVRANPSDPKLHIQLGGIYLRLGNFPAAEAEARLAREDGGDEDETAPLLAQAMLEQNKVTQLIQQIQPADRDPSAEAVVRLDLGLAHLALQETKEAEPLLHDAERLNAKDWRPKLAIARLLLLKGDMAGAEAELQAARAIVPDNADVLRLSAEILRSKGDTDGALGELNKILAQRPDDLGSLVSRANILIGKNQMTDAQRDVDHALKIAPNSISAAYLNALLMAKQGKLNQADDALTKISEGFGSLPSGFYLQGAVKYALGQYAQAEEDLTRYIAARPDQPAARRLLAMIALRNGNPKRAIDLLKPVVAADPTDTASAAALARAYVLAGMKDEAVEVYQREADAQPQDAKAQAEAALMRIRYGNATEGVGDLEKIAESGKGADIAGPLLVIGDLRSGNVAKAASTAEEMAKKEPDDPIAQNLLGSVRIAQGRLSDARAVFEALVKKDENFLAARRNLAQVLIAMKQPDEAKAIWLDLLKKQPDDVKSLEGLAELAAQRQDADEVVKRLTEAQNASPKNPEPGVRLVAFYESRKDWSKANATAQGLMAKFPGNPNLVALAASVRADAGDPAGAVTMYRPLTDRFPKDPAYWQRYAVFQNRAGDKAGAQASLEKALELSPASAQYMGELVNLVYESKGATAALQTARSFAAAQPVASDLLVAGVLASTKQTDEAIAVLTRGLKEHPATPIAARLAELVYGTGKHEEAKTMLQNWITAHDDATAARLALGSIYMIEGNDDQAAQLYERVRKDAPNDVIALNNLAWIYVRKHDPKAQELAARAYRLSPTPQIADTLGWALVSSGKADEGLAYLRQAGAALPQDASVKYHLAVALQATGDKSGAKTLLEQVLKSSAAFDGRGDAQRLLDQLQRG